MISAEFEIYYESLIDRVDEYIEKAEVLSPEEEHIDRMEGEKSILTRRQYEDEKYQIQILASFNMPALTYW